MKAVDPSIESSNDPRTPWGRAARREWRVLDAVAARAPTSGAAGVGLALLAWAAHAPVSPVMLAAWLLALAVVPVVALVMARGQTDTPTVEAVATRRRRAALLAGASGLAWSGGHAALELAPSALHGAWPLLTLAFLMLGLRAYASHLATGTAFVLTLVAPFAAGAVLAGDAISGGAIAAGVCLLAASVVLVGTVSERSMAAIREEDELSELEATLAKLRTLSARRPDPVASLVEPLFEQGRDALLVADAADRISHANPAARALLGGADPVGRPVSDLVRLIDRQSRSVMGAPTRAAAREGTTLTLSPQRTLLETADGVERSVEVSATPLAGTGTLLRLTDVTEARGLADLLDYQASHDLLTGLANRTELERRIDAETERVAAGDREGALCYLDIEGVEAVNDAWGLQAGDAMLSTIAERLSARVRESDLLARIGGDHFVALLSSCAVEDAVRIAEEMREALTTLRAPSGRSTPELGASVGIALIDGERDALPGPLAAAGLAALAARDQGGDRVWVYRPDDPAVLERAELSRWLRGVRDAVREDQLRLLGQPITPIQDDGLDDHVEILVRVPDEHGELTSPVTFIAAAEHLRFMPEVDRWILSHTLDLLRDRAPSLERFATCAINLSAQSLSDPRFPDFAAARLAGTGVEPSRLQFEITETAVIRDLDAARRAIGRLRALGCRFALDDFGTGHSSYGYLRELEVDYLKIDGTLIRGVADDEADSAVVESINRVAHALGMRTIAEHVTSDEMLATLRKIGVDYAQGTQVGSPLPLE